jgi:hypothetical protein
MLLHLCQASAVRQSTGGSNFSPLDLDCNLLAIKKNNKYVSLVGQSKKKKEKIGWNNKKLTQMLQSLLLYDPKFVM